MSLTKREFEDEINSSAPQDYSQWEGYEEYLYQQYGYEEPVEDMYAYFQAQELIASRKEEKGIESPTLVLSPLKNDLEGKDNG